MTLWGNASRVLPHFGQVDVRNCLCPHWGHMVNSCRDLTSTVLLSLLGSSMMPCSWIFTRPPACCTASAYSRAEPRLRSPLSMIGAWEMICSTVPEDTPSRDMLSRKAFWLSIKPKKTTRYFLSIYPLQALRVISSGFTTSRLKHIPVRARPK